MALLVKGYLEENDIETWIQPLYFPDETMRFKLFWAFKYRLSGIQLQNWAEIKQAIQKMFDDGLIEGLFVKRLPESW